MRCRLEAPARYPLPGMSSGPGGTDFRPPQTAVVRCTVSSMSPATSHWNPTIPSIQPPRCPRQVCNFSWMVTSRISSAMLNASRPLLNPESDDRGDVELVRLNTPDVMFTGRLQRDSRR